MTGTTRRRRLIALLAAYVVALQGLLLPLTVAAGASFDSNPCAAFASTDGVPPPANHDSGCPCAAGCGMHCCAQTVAVPPQVELALVTPVAAVRLAPAAVERLPAPAHFCSQRARAPPYA